MSPVSTNDWVERRISLRDKHHLHMRPAQKIVETASHYHAEVRAVKDHLDLSAKSILDMIEFAAHMVNRASQDDNEFVFRAREMIHADVHHAGCGELPHGGGQHLQLFLGGRQVRLLLKDPLRGLDPRDVRVAEDRETVGPQRQHLVNRAGE